MKRISHPCNQYINHASSARVRSIVPLYDLEIRVKCGLFFIKTVSTVFLLRFIIDILNVNVFGFWFDENDIELINDNDHPVRLKNQNYQNSSWCWIKRTIITYCKIAYSVKLCIREWPILLLTWPETAFEVIDDCWRKFHWACLPKWFETTQKWPLNDL